MFLNKKCIMSIYVYKFNTEILQRKMKVQGTHFAIVLLANKLRKLFW